MTDQPTDVARKITEALRPAHEAVRALGDAVRHLGDGIAPITRTPCCGDPTNLDGGAHPWVHISEDGPGDVYRCPECGATDVD